MLNAIMKEYVMNIKIVTDSSANLLDGMMPEVSSVPLKISTSERDFVDNSQLDVDQMLTYLRQYKGKSGTACPNVAEWLDQFEGGDWIFAVTISSKLSGCYQSACIAAQTYQEHHPDAKVMVIDSLSTGPEMVLIIEQLRELISQGLHFEQICDAIAAYQSHTHLIFSLESMDNLSKNGRIPVPIAKAVSLLGLRIVCSALDGALHPLHKCRGEKRAITQLWKTAEEMGYHGGKVRISHTHNLDGAQGFAALVREKYPDCDIEIMPNRGLCGFYAEQGGLIIGFSCDN